MKYNTKFFMILSFGVCFGQSPFEVDWVFNPNVPILNSVVDSNGNLYAVGHFTGSIDFSTNDTNEVILNANSTYRSIFITKYSNSGELMWAKKIYNSLENSNVTVISLNIINETLYVFGKFNGNLILDYLNESSSPHNLITDNWSLFIGKFNLDGNVFFSGKLDGTGNIFSNSTYNTYESFDGTSYSTNIHYSDFDDSFFIFGNFSDTIDFDITNDNEYNRTAVGTRDLFVAKYTNEGTLLSCKTMGHEYNIAGVNSLVTDELGNIYIGGLFRSDDFDFDFTDSVFSLSSGTYDSSNGGTYPKTSNFVAKYDSNFNLIYANSYEGFGIESHIKALHYNQNSLYANIKSLQLGYYYTWSSSKFMSLNPSSGDILWENSLSGGGALGTASIMSLKTDSQNDIFISGFEDEGKGFFASYDSNGDINYGASGVNERIFNHYGDNRSNITNINILNNGDLILTGLITWATDVDLDMNTSSEYWISQSDYDSFVVKYNSNLLGTYYHSEDKSNITIYPNPTNSNIYFNSKLNSTKNNLKIFDISGQLIFEEHILNDINNHSLNVDYLKSGIYILKITNENGSKNHKFIRL